MALLTNVYKTNSVYMFILKASNRETILSVNEYLPVVTSKYRTLNIGQYLVHSEQRTADT